jgi:Flp pilus assembly protein TadG
MLFPAAVLVIFVLGAIAVDASIAFLAKREINDASAALANDLAVQAISAKAFYASPDGAPRIELDPEFVRQQSDAGLLTDRIRSLLDSHYRDVVAAAEVTNGCVIVTVSARGSYVFSGIVAGAHRTFHLAASSGATPRRNRGPSAC